MKYYKAYDERYKTIHGMGKSWASDVPTPIVGEIAARYGIKKTDKILDAGCGEGRDALSLLRDGYNVDAIDVSPEAIDYCRKKAPQYTERFRVFDCLAGEHAGKYDFVYSVAVIHMLTEDADRRAFFDFVKNSLTSSGKALVCSMGDGRAEHISDPRRAFDIAERTHDGEKVRVAETSCRIASFETLEAEIRASGLSVIEKGITSSPPEFSKMLYFVLGL